VSAFRNLQFMPFPRYFISNLRTIRILIIEKKAKNVQIPYTFDNWTFGPTLIPKPQPWDHKIYNFHKGLPVPSKYLFSFNSVSIALRLIDFLNYKVKKFLHKYIISIQNLRQGFFSWKDLVKSMIVHIRHHHLKRDKTWCL
jgi:hypothetical protein